MKNTFILFLCLLPFFASAQMEEGILLGTWNDPSLVGSSAYDNAYNEVWGYAPPNSDKEYAIIGSTAGTHFIDVTNPENITEAFFVEGGHTGTAIIHRDYHDHAGYLYAVCDEGNMSTLQIIDLNDLPNSISVVYDSNELIRRSHNIFIDAATERLYALATANANGFSPLKIFDISDPVNPSLLSSHNSFGGNTVGHVHDAFVKENIGYLNCGYDGLYVVDFTEIGNPVLLGSMTDYLMSGYNHSGWISEDGSYYYFSDENHAMDVKAVDVSDFSDMNITTFFDAGPQADANSIPHNQVVAGDYLYVSYYYDGLQVNDISDPANPERVLFYNTSTLPNTQSYEGAWGVYPFLPSGNILVSDMQEGLFVVDGIEEDISMSSAAVHESILLDVFPQPAKEQLNIRIKLEQGSENSQLQLLDLMGRVVWSRELDLNAGQNDLHIDKINKLSAGYYILKVQGADWEMTERVIFE